MKRLPLIESLEDRRLLSASPLTARGVRVTAVEGQAFTLVPVATLKDKTPEAASAYAATIAWGDGSSSAGTVVANGTGAFVVDGSHTYVARGGYRTTVAVTETDGNTAHTASFSKVQNAPITLTGKDVTGTAGLAIQAVVATYTDADPRSANGPVAGQVARIRWGDHTTSVGTLALNTTTHRIEVSGTHTYAKPGPFAASVVIREGNVPPTTATFSTTIAAPVPVTSPSFVGTFIGTAKAGGGGGFFDDLIGDAVGSKTFELTVTRQTIDTLTGTLSIDGNSVSGDLAGSLLNNRKFYFKLSGTAGSITIFGRISADGSILAGRIEAKYSGLSILKFKGEFNGKRQ